MRSKITGGAGGGEKGTWLDESLRMLQDQKAGQNTVGQRSTHGMIYRS